MPEADVEGPPSLGPKGEVQSEAADIKSESVAVGGFGHVYDDL